MLEINEKKRERAILVAVKTDGHTKERVHEYLEELEMLADTAGADTILKVYQERHRYDKAFFIGKGKAEEVAELAELNEVSLVIFDDDLQPTQVRNLEKLIDKKILDRSGLILDIFASHAQTREAKTQVELAQLEYMLPRLTRAWTHLSKQFGGIGTKGPGETQIETDRRLIRTRISKLKERLDKIETQNQISSFKRKQFFNASLVGYTNAGKSTLLNLLTDSTVLAENKLFATLDSTTRSYDIDSKRKILMSDTVGFIRKLPHNLIASFKSTLNVVRDADIIMHIVDISHPFFEDHIKVVNDTLKELDCENSQRFIVFNKIDMLADKSRLEEIKEKHPDSIIISAHRGINIGTLKEKLVELVEQNHVEKTVELENSNSKLISQIHQLAEVLSIEYEGDKVLIKYRAEKNLDSKISGLIKAGV